MIPETALLKVNLRWFTEKNRKLIIDGIKRNNEDIAHTDDLHKEKYRTTDFNNAKKDYALPIRNDLKKQ